MPKNRRPKPVDLKDVDWTGVSKEMAITILEQGDKYLKAQLDVSLASARRALTLGSVFATLGTAVIATSLAIFKEFSDTAMLIGGVSTGVSMFIAAWLGLASARPVPFSPPGSQPKQWWPGRKKSLVGAIGGETENYQSYIERNELMMAKNANTLERGWRFALASPVVGAYFWFAARCLNLYLGPS